MHPLMQDIAIEPRIQIQVDRSVSVVSMYKQARTLIERDLTVSIDRSSGVNPEDLDQNLRMDSGRLFMSEEPVRSSSHALRGEIVIRSNDPEHLYVSSFNLASRQNIHPQSPHGS
jgi:hypothetical protein